MTTSVTRGTALWLEFEIEPYTYLSWGDQDYIEIEKIPAIILQGITTTGNTVLAQQSVRDISANQAIVRNAPFRLRIEINVSLLGEGNRTLLEMWDKTMSYFANNGLLTWEALDEEVTMFMLNEGNFVPKPNLDGEHSTSFSLVLTDVYLWFKTEETLPLIQQVNLTIDSPELQGGRRYTGANSL